MLIYADRTLNTFYIQGVSSGPVNDYVIERDGDLISISRLSSGVYEIKNYPYNLVLAPGTGAFRTADDTYRYLVSLTVPSFPMRFTVSYPLTIDPDFPNVRIDPVYIEENIDLVDGQNF